MDAIEILSKYKSECLHFGIINLEIGLHAYYSVQKISKLKKNGFGINRKRVFVL